MIQGMPTWEASAREREQVLRAHYARKSPLSPIRARRRAVLALLVALGVAAWLAAPWVLEIAAGAGLVALGLLWLAWRTRPRRRYRLGVLGLVLAVLALIEALHPGGRTGRR